MGDRKPLKQNTVLRFTNHAGGGMCFVVNGVAGYGGSCIVYDGYYVNNAGSRNTVRIKECYPYKLHIERSGTGRLAVSGREYGKFEAYKRRIRRSFEIANTLHEAGGLTNLTSNVFDLYEANDTVYIAASYVEGRTLSEMEFETLRDAVRAVMGTAKSIDRIHRQGYLYLDVKPENILVYHETPDLIQLFDFDSVIPIDAQESITEYRAAYSAGFAPIEQKTGKTPPVGKYTDVYSIGALLFYLLFGRAPRAMDCGADVVYDYTGLKWGSFFQDRLYKELTAFFHHTLRAYCQDRYQDMEAVIEKLEEIAKYADLSVPFFCSGYAADSGDVAGREEECGRLLDWYQGKERLIFVTGMGGIGKSTVVRKFVSDNRVLFDSAVYLRYKGSICDTIADDVQFCINSYEKDADESIKEYYARKMKAAGRLAADTNTLLVIDDFDGVLSEDFMELLNVNWKIIAITRSDMSCFGYAYQRIGELREKEDLRRLFESNLGRKCRADEYRRFDRIVEMAAGHTLVLVLIARQIARSYLGMDEALKLAEAYGFSGIAAEKVNYVRDGKVFYGKVSAILRAVYDVSALSEDKKKCLKILSLFDFPGIDRIDAKELLKLESLDELNELRDLGWLETADGKVRMHPLIQETIHQIGWTDEYRGIAVEEMQKLCKEIKCSGRQGLGKSLSMSKSVLSHCGKDERLSAEDIYKDLMFVTLINLPRDQEDYIIRNAEKLFHENARENPYSVIELYDYVVYLLCQKENYEKAKEYLKRAHSFAKERKDHYIWGLYYDMLNDFQEALLGGAYGTGEQEGTALRKKMFVTIDKAIHHMGKAKHENAKHLYVKYVLSKAGLMIRSMPEKGRKIKALLSGTKSIIEQNIPEDAELCSVYYMMRAWYYTLCEPDESAVVSCLKKSADINEGRGISGLDEVDYFYLPAANMMCELGKTEEAFSRLEEAFALCDAHTDEVPYIRRKLDLLECELDVCYGGGDMEGCRRVLQRIDSVNQEAAEFDILKKIPDALRDKIDAL